MTIGRTNNSGGLRRRLATAVALLLGCGHLASSPTTVHAYVAVQVTQPPSVSPPSPTGAPTILEGEQYGNGGGGGGGGGGGLGSPTSAPSLLEVPGSFTKEPLLDDDTNDSNSTTINSNATNTTGGSPSPGNGFGNAADAAGDQASSTGGGGLSTGGVVGVTFGCGIAAGLLLALAFVYVRRRKERMTRRSSSPLSSGTSGPGLEVKKFSTGTPPASPGRSQKSAAATAVTTSAGSASSSKGSKDDEDGSDSPDPTEYSFTVSSSREGDEVVITAVSPRHPLYAQHALRALEEGDGDDMDDEHGDGDGDGDGDDGTNGNGDNVHDETADEILLCEV